MIIVRLLDSDKDHDLLVEAWHFRDTAPRWFRECMDIFRESLEEYLENSYNELHFGVFEKYNYEQRLNADRWVGEEGRLLVTVRMIPEEPGVWNLHLSARRGTSFEILLAACEDVKDRMYERGQSFYGYLPERNRTIAKLYESLGFADSGLRVFKGVVHGKVVAWKHYWILNPNNDCASTG